MQKCTLIWGTTPLLHPPASQTPLSRTMPHLSEWDLHRLLAPLSLTPLFAQLVTTCTCRSTPSGNLSAALSQCFTSSWRTVKSVIILAAVQKRLGNHCLQHCHCKHIGEPALLWNAPGPLKRAISQDFHHNNLLNTLMWMLLVFRHRARNWNTNSWRDAKLANLEEQASAGRNTAVRRVLLDPQTPLTRYILFILSETLSSK